MAIPGMIRIRDEFIFGTLAERPSPGDRDEDLALISLVVHSLRILRVLLYAVCYNLGLMVLWRAERLHQRYTAGALERQRRRQKQSEVYRGQLRRWGRQVLLPLGELARALHWARSARSAVHPGGPLPLSAVLARVGSILWRLVLSFLNLLAPVLAVLLLVNVVQYWGNLSYGLVVEYGGTVIGNVRDEAQFEEAYRQMDERMQSLPPGSVSDTIPRFNLKKMDATDYTDTNLLADRMIALSGLELFEGYSLYIDGIFQGGLTAAGCDWLLSHMDNLLSNPELPGTAIGFNRRIKVEAALLPQGAQTTQENVERLLVGDTATERSYTVRAGDTPMEIAAKNGIDYPDLLRLNPQIETTLKPGDVLTVAGRVQYLQVMSATTQKRREVVPFTTERVTDNDEYIGYFKILNEGENGEREITSELIYSGEEIVDQQDVGFEFISEPVPQRIIVGGKRPTSTMQAQNDIIETLGDEMFIWPVDGGYISTPIWGYRGHTGTDIAGIPAGTTIRAAASGRVVYSGYTAGGYGRHVIIQHSNGIQTLYGHNSQNLVSVGQEVIQGQKIAAVGSTGNSTGNHCHFEIIINGQHMDARNYIGRTRSR